MGNDRIFEGTYDGDPAYPESFPRKLAEKVFEVRYSNGGQLSSNAVGTVEHWFKAEGEQVARGEPLAVVVFHDAVDEENPHDDIGVFVSPYDGRIAAIDVQPGDTLPDTDHAIGRVEFDVRDGLNHDPLAEPLSDEHGEPWQPANLQSFVRFTKRDKPGRDAWEEARARAAAEAKAREKAKAEAESRALALEAERKVEQKRRDEALIEKRAIEEAKQNLIDNLYYSITIEEMRWVRPTLITVGVLYVPVSFFLFGALVEHFFGLENPAAQIGATIWVLSIIGVIALLHQIDQCRENGLGALWRNRVKLIDDEDHQEHVEQKRAKLIERDKSWLDGSFAAGFFIAALIVVFMFFGASRWYHYILLLLGGFVGWMSLGCSIWGITYCIRRMIHFSEEGEFVGPDGGVHRYPEQDRMV